MMKRYITFALVAVFSFAFASCSNDDDTDDGSISSSPKKEYTYLFNGEKYYYGETNDLGYGITTTSIQCYFDLKQDYYEQDLDYCFFLLGGQDVPLSLTSLRFDEDGNVIQPADHYEIEGQLIFKKFDPKSLKKGDELEMEQAIQLVQGKYLRDASNYLRVIRYTYGSKVQSATKEYTWTGAPVGKIRFVSYGSHPDSSTLKVIVLEFNNVTFEVYGGGNYDSHPYKPQTVKINGEIAFSSSIAG